MFSTGFTAFLFSVDFDEYKLGRGILSMELHGLEDSSMKLWFLAII